MEVLANLAWNVELHRTANIRTVENTKSIWQATKVIRKVIIQRASKMGSDVKSGPAQ